MAFVSPLSLYESAKEESDLLILVFYRGKWCAFCLEWLKEWKDIPNFEEQLRDHRATMLVVCSEPQDYVEAFLEACKLKLVEGVQGIGDPENAIVNAVKSAGLLRLTVTGAPGPYDAHGLTYPKGMVQPGVLIMKKDGSVVYSWATVPKMRNLMGAISRPSSPAIWRYTVNALTSPTTASIKKPRSKSLRYFFANVRKMMFNRRAKSEKRTDTRRADH